MEYDAAMSIRSPDKSLAELILYISERSEGDDHFGAVKLNKLLLYADFLAYLKLGASITGQEYQKLVNGPAPRRLLPVRQQLVEDGSLAIRKTEYFNRHQDRTFALRSADLSGFTSDQIALVTRVIDSFRDRNGTEISELSHQFHGWNDAEIGETIPYEMAMISNRTPTEQERQRCLQDRGKADAVLAGVVESHDA